VLLVSKAEREVGGNPQDPSSAAGELAYKRWNPTMLNGSNSSHLDRWSHCHHYDGDSLLLLSMSMIDSGGTEGRLYVEDALMMLLSLREIKNSRCCRLLGM